MLHTIGPVAEALCTGEPVVLTGAEAVELASSGEARALLVRETESHRRAGGRPELRSPSRTVLQVLRLTGVADLFDVVAA